MSLSDSIQDPAKKTLLIDDCVALVDEEVASKSGLSGITVKTGYAAVKGIKPGFVRKAVGELIGPFAEKLDPLWDEAKAAGDAVVFFEAQRSRVADALLSVTDAKVETAKSGTIRSAYGKLRGTAKKNVEQAVPRLARLLAKYDA